MGTPGFIAPERLHPDATLAPSADIYSLGATLYCMLALRAPLYGMDMRTLLTRAISGNIPPPAAYNDPDFRDPDCSDSLKARFLHCHEGVIPLALSDIAMRAMATRSKDRYASVRDLQEDIEAYQTGRIWNLVADQDFSGPDPLAHWEITGGHGEVRNGELCLSHGEPQVLLFKGELPGDVRIEFEARQEGVYLNSIGAFIGAIRPANPKEMVLTGYKFEFGGFDNSMNVIERSGCQMISQRVSPLERGAVYSVCAERNGNHLKLAVNGEEILSILDEDPLSGADRTAVGLFGWLAETIISRIRVYTMGTPWKRDVIEIAESQVLKGHYAIAETLLNEALLSGSDPARVARAQKAQAMARHYAQQARELEVWKNRLHKAWPNAHFDLRLSNDGYSLELSNCGITDLEPLRGLPLASLTCAHNRLASLEPLRGMPLNTFNCSGNAITDLEPLRGMHLHTFVSEMCPIASLEPLRGMPLRLINIGGCRVGSLDPLRGMELTFLSCWGNRVHSLEPLSGMASLSALYCNVNGLETLEHLQGLPLVTMNCSGNCLRDLEPLRGMPLGVLHTGENQIESLEPLRGMTLRMLSCQGNRIASLEPLRGMRLASLTCGANPLTDIDPFIQHPPDDFRFDSATLPAEALVKAREAWAGRYLCEQHLKNLDILLAIRQNDPARLREMASEFRNRLYLFIPMFLTWEEARAFCERFGGRLLTIPDKETDVFIKRLFLHGTWFWMGLRRTERGHEWISGEPFAYSNFVDPLQEQKIGPNIYSGMWTFDDVPGAHNSFMIEWDK